MEDMEQKIQEVLQDPAQMQRIMQLARSFVPEPPQDEPAQTPETDSASVPMAQLLTQMGKTDPRQEDLLRALKPLLKPGRREKIDRALQAARISHLADFVLRSRQPDEN